MILKSQLCKYVLIQTDVDDYRVWCPSSDHNIQRWDPAFREWSMPTDLDPELRSELEAAASKVLRAANVELPYI